MPRNPITKKEDTSGKEGVETLLLSQVKEVSVMTLQKAASSHELVGNRLYYETKKTEMWMLSLYHSGAFKAAAEKMESFGD